MTFWVSNGSHVLERGAALVLSVTSAAVGEKA